MTRRFQNFINGRCIPPNSNDWIDSVNPATGEVWAQIARGNVVDVRLAVESAKRASEQHDWRYNLTNRSKILHDIADRLDREHQKLIEIEINDNGKRVREVKAQMSGLGDWYRHFAVASAQMEVENLNLNLDGVSAYLDLIPYGVVGAITAWNSPLMIAAWKVAPALAGGNAVVIKPSELASASTVVFAELLSDTVPNGLINVVTGFGDEVGTAIIESDEVKKVSFTGSEIDGSRVATTAAKHVKPVTLELGGKSPQIVFRDADLENAINGIMSGIFFSNGQSCVAGSRLIIHDEIKHSFVGRLKEKLEQLQFGDPLSEDTDIGPIANKAQFDKVLSMIGRAKKEGVKITAGGSKKVVSGFEGGFFIEPTILENVSSRNEIWRHEVFGPVLCVHGFSNDDEAVSLANDTEYGLAAGIWSVDEEFANKIAAKIDAGTVYINHYRSVSACAPVGGVKKSGYGRELGPNAIRDFMQEKAIWLGKAVMPNPFG